MAEDEFDALLKRCNQRLSEIALEIPSLDVPGARRGAKVSLLPPPVPERRAPPRDAAPPEPAAPPAAVRAPQPQAPAPRTPEPLPVEEDEIDVFPPLSAMPRTPPPVRLQRVETPSPKRAPSPPPAPAAPARHRPWPAYAAAAALALTLSTLGYWSYHRAPDDLAQVIDGADAMTLRPEKGDAVVARGDELLTVSRTGATTERSRLDGRSQSLAWSQGSLWSADGRATEVTERREGARSTVYRLNHVPSALFAKGNSVWTVEKDGHALHQYLVSRSILGAMLQPLDLFDIPEVSPEAFAFDEAGTLWVADDQTRSLIRLRVDKGVYKIVDRAPLSPFLGPAGVFRGLAVDGDAVWILVRSAADGSASLRRIRVGRLDWTPA